MLVLVCQGKSDTHATDLVIQVNKWRAVLVYGSDTTPPIKMRTTQARLAIGALLFITCTISACTNEDGDGGTSDGNAGEAYELRNKDHLAPSMDSVDTGANAKMDTIGTSNGE